MQRKQRSFIAILSFVLIMLTTYAYSALATNLSITGEANFRKVADIRVTNISINGASGATSEYENYKKDTITAGFTLNNTSSTMTYNVTITNNGDIDQAIYNLTTQSSNNSGLSILIDGQPINQALPIIVPFGTSRTITITYSSSTPGTVNVVNKFDFRKVYYITYNLKGGTSSSSDLTNRQVKYENVDLTLTNDEPTLSGYEFLGWTDEQNGTTVKFEPGDTYTIDGANKILYAIYKKDNYTITFDAQDGSENQTKEVQVGDQIGTLPTHQRDGYHFDGWYTGQTDGTQITTTTVPDSDKTYYAHYTPYRLTINYYAGGATKNGNTTLSNQKLTTDTYDYDGENLATAGLKNYDSASSTWNLIKDGYHADKYWYLGNNTSTTKVHEDTAIAKVQDLATALNKGDDFKTGNVEVNIYAGWTANTYKLHFDKNNTNATGVMSDQTLTYDAPEANRKINKNIFTYTGHTFVGWNTQANGQGTPYTDEQVINLVTTNNQTINLYAQWILTNYSITYTMNNGNVGEECASEGGTCSFTGTKEVCFGADTSYICKEATSSISCSTTGFGSDPVSGQFKHCYIKSTNPTTYNIETNTFTLNPVTKKGYTFTGWTGSNGTTAQTNVSIAKGSTGNKTYTANFTPKTYTLTINPNGGTYNNTTSTTTKTLTYGSKDNNSIGVPTRTGYTFAGWSTPYTMYNVSGNAVSGPNWTASYPDGTYRGISNVTATAQWTANELTFSDKTLSTGTYGTAYTSTAFDQASNGTGSYKYTIKSGAPTGATIDSTNRTISFSSTTAAGTYNVVVTATDNNSGVTKDATMSITINKAANPTTFTAVTGLKYGSTAAMVTVGSKQGTPYYAVGTELTASNYSTAGSTTIPTASSRNAGTYTIYYYIPEVSGKYNVKSGSVSVTIAKTSCPLTVSNGSMYTGATMTLSTRASNNVGTLSYALKSGGNNTTTASTISNGVLTAGAMSTANDNNQTVDVQITEAASTNYNSCTKDVAITVQKNTRTLSWSSTTPAANATLTYGTSYSATASASGSGGTAGSITYSSNNTSGATINSTSGAITVENGNSKAVTITATMARTATVAQATTTRAFTTGKANGYVNLSANSGSVTYGTASKSFTVSSSHGGGLSVSDNNSTASCAISGTTVTCSSLGSINAGTSITVTVTSAATDNYKEASKTYTLSITRAKTATTGSCINPTYNGSAQNLAGGGSNVTYTNNSQTNHGSSDYTVTVTPNSNYAWSDGTYAAKTLSCNITKATPVITLSSSSGTLNAGATTSVTATVKSGSEASAAGTLTASSNNTSSFTVAPTSSSITSTTAGATKSHTITGVAGGSGKVKFNFTPTDTTNFNSAAQVQYELTVNNKVVITINKDGSAWSSSGKTVELYESGTAKYTLTTSGSQATIYNVNPGTYDVYATKSSLDSTIVDTGVDITVSQNNHQWSEGGNYFVSISYSNVTETINYNTLTLNKGTNVTSVTGAGIYLSNQTASIAATAFTTGYHFGSWSKTSGNTPTSTTASPTTVSMSTPTELTANAALNTYTIAFNKNAPSGVTVSGSMSNLSMTYGTAKNLTANAYSATGYTFVGWNTAANGTGTAYLDKASVNNLTSTNGATVTLYAQWIKNGSVKITGINKVGTQLTASVTAPTPTPAGYTYQWYRGSTAINGATSSTYTPVAADMGSHLKVKVTATYTNYSSVTFEDQTDAMNNSYAVTYGVMSCSSAVVKVNNPAGGPSGVLEAEVVTAPSPTPDSYTYQWYRGTTAISGATSSTYTTVAADVGKAVKVRVTGVKTDYVSCYAEDSIDTTNNKSATVVTPKAVDVYYDNTNTGMTCETVQCALDNISRILVKSGATNTDVQTKEGTDPMTGNTHLCRRATSNELHTETCSQTSYYCYADGYYASGSQGTTTITYGQVGTEGTLATGDAFVCDINGDGTYNATNEMFYYVSDYYDTSSKATNSDYATLIYYNNVVNGSANTGGAAYESTGNNFYGPRTALTHMPTTISWKDVGLYKNVRAILNESNGNSISGGTSLPIGFNYKGSSSRLLTYQEVYNGCYNGSTAITSVGGLSSKCIFLLENTKYSSSSLPTNAWWFETVNASASLNAWEAYSLQSTVVHTGVSSKYEGVRPAIDVKKTDIDY